MTKKKLSLYCALFFLLVLAFTVASCSFDYGDKESRGEEQPDLIMKNVEYVRVRSASPQAKLRAELVERYEKRSMIKLQNTTFEQYDQQGEEINVMGRMGKAIFEIDTGNIFMDNNVRIEVLTEDIILETEQVEWLNDTKHLSAGSGNEVYVYRRDGTMFSGIGLQSDIRRRTWEFTGRVRGTYVRNNDNTEN